MDRTAVREPIAGVSFVRTANSASRDIGVPVGGIADRDAFAGDQL
jgi:hypothetical protein